MSKEVIESLVKGGQASAAPPLGPALGPLGVNIGKVVDVINKKTECFKGMEVPVKVIVDTDTKDFEIVVGTPPVTAMLKRELNIQKLATVDENKNRNLAGDIKLETIIKIAKAKEDAMSGHDFGQKVKQILGTCLSCGVTINGKNPKELQKDIDTGKIKF